MIRVGDLVKLKKNSRNFISIRLVHKDKYSYEEKAYFVSEPPLLVLDIFQLKPAPHLHYDRPYRVKVLHEGKIWLLRFGKADSFTRFFRKVT